jgi:L-lactate utilization protein LutB
MQEFEKERYRKLMPKLIESLKKKKFDAHFFETIEEARRFIPDQVDKDDTIGIGGSVTLRANLDLVPLFRGQGNIVYDHWDADNDKTERLKIKRTQRSADVFLSSLNAITCDGTLVNLDGGGNRVGGLCSGPKNVIAVAGTNKIVETLDLAIHRTRHLSAPINAARLKRRVPCAETGICSDCDAPERICAALLILFKKPGDIDTFTVILVNEEMGF